MPTLRSSRFLRAPENAEAISAAPPTSATTMNPTKAGVIPNASAACCTERTKISLTRAIKHRDAGQRGQGQTQGPRRFARLRVFGAAEELAMRLEREEHPQPVSGYQQQRQAHAQLLRERRAPRGVGFRDRRRNQERDRGQEQQRCLKAGARPVVFLQVVLHAAEQERRAQHEQRVGDDRAGDRRLHQHVLSGAQGGEGYDQLGQVAERGVEQATDRIACPGRHGFGGVTQERRERHDGQHG
jgi:hypothetical protein